MLSESSCFEFRLDAGKAMSLNLPAGWEIACVGGRVWLTEESGGVDVWLAQGQHCSLSRRGRTVLEADKSATLRLCRPQSRLNCAFGAWLNMLVPGRLAEVEGGFWRPVLPRRT